MLALQALEVIDLLEWAAGSWRNVDDKCFETSNGSRWKEGVLHTIVQWQGVVTIASKGRACHLNSTLTNMKFVLFAQSCSEF